MELWNAIPQVDQDYGTPSLEWTRLWNDLPRVDQDYGRPDLDWTKIMEYPPSSGPILWNVLPPKDHDN